MLQRNQTSHAGVDVIQEWLLSKRRVSIEGINLLPQENSFLKGSPLVVARGQAQAFYMNDDSKRVWILKKFLPGRSPDIQYVNAVQSLVPREPGFESGYLRQVLSQGSIRTANSPSPEFPSWIDNTILMPRVLGSDWATIADRVRDGTIALTGEQRRSMCGNLASQVQLLEQRGLAHRDLSSTNIFIDTNTWEVHLIDWDSMFHSSLTIPANTTFGTNGYIAPFVRINGSEDPRVTWTTASDRFSLAVLSVEFLTVERNSPVTGDGGLVDQDEIFSLRGNGLNQIRARLKAEFPHALTLFENALNARRPGDCPSPDNWLAIGGSVKAPSLSDVYDPQADFLRCIQLLQKQNQPAPPAPNLNELEKVDTLSFLIPKDVGAPPAPSLTAVEPIDRESLTLPDRISSSPPAPPLPRLDSLTSETEISKAAGAQCSSAQQESVDQEGGRKKSEIR